MKSPIRVKIIARGQPAHPWQRQTLRESGQWGGCQFLFDLRERDYDWLVVVDDVSRKLKSPPEILNCPDDRTIFVTTEPPAITRYGAAFTLQFQYVLTSQPADALSHPNRIFSSTGNLWFHGKNLDSLLNEAPPVKSQLLSTVCSSKQQKHTVHHARYEFTQWLKSKCPALEIYGHGVRFVEKKHQALDAYKFHLAIENHVSPHHWTEKFADPLLSYCVPIYHGCPNISDYFPKESYINIDIANRENALETIRESLSHDSYRHRYDAVIEARDLVLNRYNMLSLLSKHIESKHTDTTTLPSKRPIFGRKQMRLRHPSDFASHVVWKTRNFIHNHTGS